MSTPPTANIRINVDPTNPGQFFACCGLLELANRVSQGAEGWFESGAFCMKSAISLGELVTAIAAAELVQTDQTDATASPIFMEAPFRLRLDWWKTDDRAISGLKVWAGRMESSRIANAMQRAMTGDAFQTADLLNAGMVVYEVDDNTKKVEPFYFDARRGPNAHSRDVGFSPNDLGLTTTAFPAVEFLCLIGLQRCKPLPTAVARIYDYHTWATPLPPLLLPPAVTGHLPSSVGYRFESWFRTGQKKHKAFLTAKPKPILS